MLVLKKLPQEGFDEPEPVFSTAFESYIARSYVTSRSEETLEIFVLIFPSSFSCTLLKELL
jgi:hypothetical protein